MKQKPIPEKIREFEKHMTKQFAENRLVFERLNSIDERIGLLEIKKQLDIRKEKVQPYTAMRSTGEQVPYVKNKYCECFYPVKGGVLGSDVCHSCCLPIKPQEDVKNMELERVAMNIVHQIGDALSEAKAEDFVGKRQETNDKCIDFVYKILSIVKGE